jgi:lysophospholipase L1-like esterase
MLKLKYVLCALGALALCALALFGLQGRWDEPKTVEESKPKVVKVACIGDSITYGDGLEEREHECYPAQLGKLLGEHYCVKNYGCNAACANTNGSKPYIQQEAFKDALAFEPEVVVIMLGTNDSRKKEWTEPEKIKEGLKQIVGDFRKKSPKCRVIICTPPVMEADSWGLQSSVVASGLRELVKQFAQENELQLVDVFEVTNEAKEPIHSDGVHLNPVGAKLVAENVLKRVTAKDKK